MKKFIGLVLCGLIAGCGQTSRPEHPKGEVKGTAAPILTDRDIAEFWRYRASVLAAQAVYDAWVSAKHAQCGGGPYFGPDGNPTCTPPSAPAASKGAKP